MDFFKKEIKEMRIMSLIFAAITIIVAVLYSFNKNQTLAMALIILTIFTVATAMLSIINKWFIYIKIKDVEKVFKIAKSLDKAIKIIKLTNNETIVEYNYRNNKSDFNIIKHILSNHQSIILRQDEECVVFGIV